MTGSGSRAFPTIIQRRSRSKAFRYEICGRFVSARALGARFNLRRKMTDDQRGASYCLRIPRDLNPDARADHSGMRAAFLITSSESLSKRLRASARRRTSWETEKGVKREEKESGGAKKRRRPEKHLPLRSLWVSLSVSSDGNVPSWGLPYLPRRPRHRPVRCVSCKIEAIHFLKRPNYLTPWHGHQRGLAASNSRCVVGICHVHGKERERVSCRAMRESR